MSFSEGDLVVAVVTRGAMSKRENPIGGMNCETSVYGRFVEKLGNDVRIEVRAHKVSYVRVPQSRVKSIKEVTTIEADPIQSRNVSSHAKGKA